MKNNAGIKLESNEHIKLYSKMYIEAFKNSEIFTGWDKGTSVYRVSQETIINIAKKSIMLSAFNFDIFHYIHIQLWTHELKGKRLLIISSFIDDIKNQEDKGVLSKIYGVDLFPDCKFVYLKPPQTNGTNPSKSFDKELENFVDKIKNIRNDFDIALVSCGGYGNLVCNEIYKMNKSSIYVGGVLQMYFGIYGERWLRERKDIMKLYMNEYWIRPTVQTNGFEKIENGCYW